MQLLAKNQYKCGLFGAVSRVTKSIEKSNLRAIAPKPSSSSSSCATTITCSVGTTCGSECPCRRTLRDSSCCSTKEKIRVVTCRCGDSCTCVGCDAHPSRAMRGPQDPYTGFSNDPRRRLSIAAICAPPEEDKEPTSILTEDDRRLCGCGCSLPFASCSNCFDELCQGKSLATCS